MLTIQLGPTSGTAINLNVKYGGIHSQGKLGSKHRTLSGRLYVYTASTFIKHNFPVEFMTTANASIVNSWWENNTELLLFITSDSITEVQSLLLVNKDEPMNKFIKPYNTYKSGVLKLESY